MVFPKKIDFYSLPEVFSRQVGDPSGRNGFREIGIVKEHRNAFYFWTRWLTNKKKRHKIITPTLVTIDWHQDLAPPNEHEREDLNTLNLASGTEVKAFCRNKMNPYNDGHILSAAWLGTISDIVVICKQKFRSLDQYRDGKGNIHTIHKYTLFDDAMDDIRKNDYVILDIDLDYFTESESFRGGDPEVLLDSDSEIRSILNPQSDFFRSIFERFLGMTIATEPGFCGSMENARHIFTILDEQFFDGTLLTGYSAWRYPPARMK